MNRYSLLLAFLISGFMYSDAQLNLPVRKIGDTEYYYKKVEKKETIYGIAKELGISKEMIIKYNPSVASGLKENQWLYFPVEDFKKDEKEPIPERHVHRVLKGETIYSISKVYGISVDDLIAANPHIRTRLTAGTFVVIPVSKLSDSDRGVPYVIKSKETLYQLSQRFNVSIEQILELNPGISPTNIKTGETILIPATENQETRQEIEPHTVFIAEKVERGDSFESISSEYNITEQTLKQANPQFKKLKKGKYISIPITREDTDVDTIATDTSKTSVTNILANDSTSTSRVHDSINVALILPLNVYSETPTETDNLYTDFYRGFLLAVDKFMEEDINLNLTIHDMSSGSVSSILNSTALQKADMIFASGNDSQLQEIAAYGEQNDINVINAFSVKNEDYYNHSHFMQINTPSAYMYAAVQNKIEEDFADFRLVFIDDTDTNEEKELIPYLKKTDLLQQTISLEELNDTSLLNALLPADDRILFVPLTSSRNQLPNILHRLTTMKTEGVYTFALLGYPEWSSYNDLEKYYYTVDTYIYSRYFINSNDERVKAFNQEYDFWYGTQPVNSFPMMNMLGYDLGTYFISHFMQTGNDFDTEDSQVFEGLESCLSFQRISNWGGFINNSIFLVNYNPSGRIEKHVIK